MQISDENGPSSVASSPRSDLSSLSSDSDAYNTASARIHFGPLRSPEKKFVPIADRHKTLQPNTLSSPPRRSPRLSAPVPDSPIMSTDETDENADGNVIVGAEYHNQSRSGTPENDIFPQDEPSSILATKISRAHDNPSPPPHGRDFRGTISPHIDFDTLASLTTPSTINVVITNKDVDHTPELGSALCIDESALLALPLLAASSSELKSVASQQHIDNCSRTPFLVPETTVTTNSPSILSSPLPSSPSRTLLDLTGAGVIKDNGDLADSADEQYIENALISLEIGSLSRSTSPFVPPGISEKDGDSPPQIQTRRLQTTENPLASPEVKHSSRSLLPIVLPPSPREESKGQELPQTPIRSSSRSRSPYSFKTCSALVSTQDQFQTPPRQSRLLASPTSAQTQKKRRGKERAISPADVPVDDSQSGENQSKSATIEPTWRNKESVDIDSRRAVVDGLNGGSEKKGKKREEGMGGMTERGNHALNRELRSLSPDSTTLLTQLVPSTKTSPVSLEEPTTPQPPTFSFSVFPERQEATFVMKRAPGSENPARSAGPVRFASSSKVGFTFNDPNRTPAQRIPIEQAIAQGQISPSKAVYFNARGGVRITRNPVFNPTDTPARRVPISETTPVKAQGSKQASPVKGTPKLKGGSVALLTHLGVGKGRSGTVEQLEGRQQPWGAGNGSHVRPQFSTPRPGSHSKLPFPIVPIHDPPNSIPEEIDGSLAPPDVDNLTKGHPTGSASSIAKSVLRQHSGRSRIPRIGVKPYARPAMTAAVEIGKGGEKSTVAIPADSGATVNSTYASKPFRTVGSGNQGNSEDVAKNLPSTNVGLNVTPRARTPHDTGLTANLKRKRGAETLSTVRQAHSMVAAWQSGSGPNHSKQTPKVVAPLKASPVRKGKESFRQFVDRDPNVPTGKMVTQVSSNGTKDEAEVPVAKRSQIEDDPMLVEPINGNLAPPSPPIHDIPSPPSRIPKDNGPNSQTSPPSTNDSVSFGEVRRTARLRKPAQPSSAADVFGTVDLKPLQPRRKVTYSSAQSETVPLLGMSAVALKALTSSNTARNQKYLAATLETEIIRKEGPRPESPTVKVRTLLQRQKEEKGKQRMARAARRARRSEDGSGMSDTDGQSDHVSTDVGPFWSDDGQDTQGVHHRKHRRGPGDEEDYESPEKSERPAKRLKCEEDYCEENETAEKRRVKWDRGLSTTIYLDEVHPGTRARPKENPNAKGCLAKTAKALRLDTLGNLPNADTPLTNLVQECVIVKKFVYDNDTEPLTEVYIVRSTRSRSKKAKA